MNITYKTEYGILVVEPTGALATQDFENLAAEIQNIRRGGRRLEGIVIRSQTFPGYKAFEDMVAHARFLSEQRNKVPKVAICTNSVIGNLLTTVGRKFAGAEIKQFEYHQQDAAEKWILS